MKKKIIFNFLAFLFLISCSNDKSDNLEELINGHDWKISFYSDKSKVETDDYSEYIFSFESTGKIIASNDEDIFAGRWKEGYDDSKSKFFISFDKPYELEEISEDWEIISTSDKKLELYHKSGKDGHESFLTFEKI